MRGLKHIAWALVALLSLPAFAGGLQASYKGVPDLCDNRFTRPTTVIETCGKRDGAGNLLDVKGSNAAVYSEQFDNAAWVKTNMSVVADQVRNPLDGALDADAFVEDSTGASEHKAVDAIPIVSGEYYVYSGYVRAANRSWGALYVSTENVGVYFNARTQQVGNEIGTVLASGVVTINSEWSRAWFAFQATGTASRNTSVYIAEGNADVTFDGLNQTSLYYYGFQAEHKRSLADAMRGPGPYIRTGANDKPAFDLAPTNAPGNVCTGPQDQTGNQVCGQDFTNATGQYFSIADDDALDVFDGDHTLTLAYLAKAGAPATQGIFTKGSYQNVGMYVFDDVGGNLISARYNKTGAISTAAKSVSNTDDGLVRVVQVVRRDDVAVLCVNGACGTPVSVSTYGVDGGTGLYIASLNVGNKPADAQIFYTRLDEEALTPHELAVELAALQGVQTSIGELAASDVITDGDMEAAGVGDWTTANDAILAKATSGVHGGEQALRITYDGTNNPYAYQAILTTGKTYLISGWARGDGSYYPRLYISDFIYPWTGTTSTEWQQFNFTLTCGSGTVFRLHSNLSAAGWVEFDDVHVYEYDPTIATFSRSTTATVESGALLRTEAANKPRVGGDGGGLLIEGQATNLEEYSDFSAGWGELRIDPIACTSPDPAGSSTACVLHEDTTLANSHYANNTFTAVSGTGYTCSVYMMADQRDWSRLSFGGGGGVIFDTVLDGAFFDVKRGRVGTVGGNLASYGIEPAGNGFYRIWISSNAGGDGSAYCFVYIAEADADVVFDGLDQDSLVVFGPQLETGLFPTSYIPTSGGPVTRTADDYTIDPHPEVGPRLLPEKFEGEGVLTVEFDAKCQWKDATDVPSTFWTIVEIGGNTGTASGSRNSVLLRFNRGSDLVQAILRDDSDVDHTMSTASATLEMDEWVGLKFRFDFSDLSRMAIWYRTTIADSWVATGSTFSGNSGQATFDTTDTLIRLGQNYAGTVQGNCRIRNLRIEPREF